MPKYKIIWKYSLSVVRQERYEEKLTLRSDDEDEEVPQCQVATVQSLTASPSTDRGYGYEISNESTSETRTDNNQVREEQESPGITNEKATLVDAFNSSLNSYEETRKRIKREDTKKFFHRQYSINLVEIQDFKESTTFIWNPQNKNYILTFSKADSSIDTIESKEEAYGLIRRMRTHVRRAYPKLVLPGNVLYIYQLDDTKSKQPDCCRLLCSKVFCCFNTCQFKQHIDYDSRWAHRDEFSRIVITNRMLLDHLPNQVDDALTYFNSTRRYI